MALKDRVDRLLDKYIAAETNLDAESAAQIVLDLQALGFRIVDNPTNIGRPYRARPVRDQLDRATR